MNYIQKLQRENEALRAAIKRASDEIRDVRATLAGPKFQGFEPDGSRKDWAAVADILGWLGDIDEAMRVE